MQFCFFTKVSHTFIQSLYRIISFKMADGSSKPPQPTPGSIAETTTTVTKNSDTSLPSYESSKSSSAYVTGKALLASGDFEAVLSAVGDALGATLESLPGSLENRELHESLGPLYYLYGSTLLYSVEENTDDAMIQQQKQTQLEYGHSDSIPASVDTTKTPGPINEQAAEDIQIAWENLESARTILENMCKTKSMYQLDLAQVHLRLGDLQRGNGNYESAIGDYEKALEIRTKINGTYDRSVADCHYMLGMTTLLLASGGGESDRNLKETSNEGSQKLEEATFRRKGQIEEWRRRAILHYLACGRALGGLLGKLCGVEPNDISSDGLVAGISMHGQWWDEDEPKKMSSSSKREEDVRVICSLNLQKIRERVKNFKAKLSEDGATVFDLKEVLDEIQETVDASDESVQAVGDISKLKAEREKEAIEEDNAKALEEGIRASKATATAASVTTTIGFGHVDTTTDVGKCVNAIGFGQTNNSSASTATASVPRPMMVVKKKKRPPQSSDIQEINKIKRIKPSE